MRLDQTFSNRIQVDVKWFLVVVFVVFRCILPSLLLIRLFKGKRIHRSGLCISGQRIRDATERLKRCSCTDNMKIIVNLGTVDILHGRDLSDMCQDYINLVNFCQYRNIKIVITTLPPIANRLHVEADVKKWCDFNEFLIKRFSNKMLVVDIVPTMMCVKTSKVLFDCYQA